MNRRTTPKVKNGKVQKKNRHKETENCWNTRQDTLVIDKENPGKGYKHFLKKRDIEEFLEILPNWKEIDIELDAILLASGDCSADGWYSNGVIGICAWDKNLSISMYKEYFNDHKELFQRLSLKYEIKPETVICHFTEEQIRAFQLLHILLHELGHHHDRINTKSRISSARGESYAETYAEKYEKEVWKRYFDLRDN